MDYAPQFIAFVMASGFWVATYTYMLRTTRPATVEPDPPTQELPGAESPAVVSLRLDQAIEEFRGTPTSGHSS